LARLKRAISDISHCGKLPAISGQSTDARRGVPYRGEHCQAAQRAAADIEGHSTAAELGQPRRLSAECQWQSITKLADRSNVAKLPEEKQDLSNPYSIGTALFVAAAVLLYIGLPNSAAESPRFLRFEAAPLLYPPLIMALLAGSVAAILSGYFGLH
jgi:hypothetical protein